MTLDPRTHFAPRRIGRRTLLAAATLTTLVPLPGLAARGGAGGGTTTRNALSFPPSGTNGQNVAAARTTVSFGGTSQGLALTYNGRSPGPTFEVSRGSTFSATLKNQLSQPSSIHWHGLIVPTQQDGQPQDAVAALSGQRTYSFTVDQRAALNFYHPHPHMLTGEQVCLGLAGAFIVRDNEEAALNLPSGPYELPLVTRDVNFDKQGNLLYNPRSSGFVGSVPLVNGTRNATHSVGVALYRLRIVNAANARLFRLALMWGATAQPLHIIGNDGGLLETAHSATEIEFGPGERLDLLVSFQGIAPGGKLMLRDLNSGWDLLEFIVVDTIQSNALSVPGALSTITALAPPTTVTRFFSFDGMSKINGREYDMERIDFTVPHGVTERWRFTTSGNAPHPVHVHGASFQVLTRSGGRGTLFPWEAGWKDTVLLKDNETVDVAIRFDGGFVGAENGRYVMHCHKLEHEDMGMMANFIVE